jgi:hypothetical protein
MTNSVFGSDLTAVRLLARLLLRIKASKASSASVLKVVVALWSSSSSFLTVVVLLLQRTTTEADDDVPVPSSDSELGVMGNTILKNGEKKFAKKEKTF